MNVKSSRTRRWILLHKIKNSKKRIGSEEIIKILLKLRGIKKAEEIQDFFKPENPQKIKISQLNINQKQLKSAITRIKKAVKEGEKVIIYGDYDADGICASAILWEVLYSLKSDVAPYIPERFSEGYGLNAGSIKKLKAENPNIGLIITVDNGITANKAIDAANKLGIDVIICDHHQKGNFLPKAHSIIHTDVICASAIAWVLAREIIKNVKSNFNNINRLELAAIGTIADQIPLIGVNRSFAKFGLEELNRTKRAGLNAMFEEAGLNKGNIGTYAVGFIIAPRLNAMGRLENAIDSLRLLCTKDSRRAKDLAVYLGKTNLQRQKVVEEVLLHAKEAVLHVKNEGILVISHESYHEGVIGLAAAKLAEEFWRPAIVLSKGKEISKASARSIPGFNIIEFIHKYDRFIESGGGHPMAAGFSIRTENIEKFSKLVSEESAGLLTDEITTKTLKIDMILDFDQLTFGLAKKLEKFEPFGMGNPVPVFMTKASVVDARLVGADQKHIKLRLENKNIKLSAIAFGMSDRLGKLTIGKEFDIAYNLEENKWNGNSNLELKIKDIKI